MFPTKEASPAADGLAAKMLFSLLSMYSRTSTGKSGNDVRLRLRKICAAVRASAVLDVQAVQSDSNGMFAVTSPATSRYVGAQAEFDRLLESRGNAFELPREFFQDFGAGTSRLFETSTTGLSDTALIAAAPYMLCCPVEHRHSGIRALLVIWTAAPGGTLYQLVPLFVSICSRLLTHSDREVSEAMPIGDRLEVASSAATWRLGLLSSTARTVQGTILCQNGPGARIGKAIEQWASRHPRPDQPLLVVGSESFSPNAIAVHVQQETALGKLLVEEVIESAISLITEGV